MKVAQVLIAVMVLILIHPDLRAEEPTPPPDLAQQIQDLRKEVRAYHDELDAARRTQGKTTAGYKNGFFIGSDDGTFNLRINVEGQVRYIVSHSEQPAGTDEDETAFVIRRARLDFRGHAIDPKLTYRLRLNVDRAAGGAFLEYAYLGYAFADGWNVNVGQLKPQFAREESVNAFRQLAVERSYMADYFTIDFTQGAELSCTADALRAFLSVHDGSYASNSEFNADRTTVAVAGRFDYRLAGDWKQFDDFTSWSQDQVGILIGAAIDYEIGDAGSGTHTPDLLKYTADLSAEFGMANLFVAVYGQHFYDTAPVGSVPTNLDGANQIGAVIQGGVFVAPDKFELFGRYEWIDFDRVYYRNNGAGTQTGTANLADDDLSILTAGVNYYVHKHNAKLSLDAQYALDPVPVSNTGGGLLRSSADDQFVLRAQFQWSF